MFQFVVIQLLYNFSFFWVSVHPGTVCPISLPCSDLPAISSQLISVPLFLALFSSSSAVKVNICLKRLLFGCLVVVGSALLSELIH